MKKGGRNKVSFSMFSPWVILYNPGFILNLIFIFFRAITKKSLKYADKLEKNSI